MCAKGVPRTNSNLLELDNNSTKLQRKYDEAVQGKSGHI